MQKISFLLVIGVTMLFSCKKSGSHSTTTGAIPAGLANNWQLAQVHGWVGPTDFVDTPAADSIVLLTFRSDGTYTSFLNGQIVCQGNFVVDTSLYRGWSNLALINFKPTGLPWAYSNPSFGDSSWTYLNISHDTLNLSPDYNSYDALHIFVFLQQ